MITDRLNPTNRCDVMTSWIHDTMCNSKQGFVNGFCDKTEIDKWRINASEKMGPRLICNDPSKGRRRLKIIHYARWTRTFILCGAHDIIKTARYYFYVLFFTRFAYQIILDAYTSFTHLRQSLQDTVMFSGTNERNHKHSTWLNVSFFGSCDFLFTRNLTTRLWLM